MMVWKRYRRKWAWTVEGTNLAFARRDGGKQ